MQFMWHRGRLPLGMTDTASLHLSLFLIQFSSPARNWFLTFTNQVNSISRSCFEISAPTSFHLQVSIVACYCHFGPYTLVDFGNAVYIGLSSSRHPDISPPIDQLYYRPT